MTIAKPYIVLFLIAIVLGTYYPAIFATFNSVDDVNMINSLINVDSIDLRQLFVPQSGGTYYRPLLYLTFMLDGYLWGFQASFMHLENIVLHALNAVLVFLISDRLFTRHFNSASFAAFFAALLFALHPINTEAVNWISGRTDVMAGSFLLLSLYALVRSSERPGRVLVILAGSAFFLACLCKDSAVFALPGYLFFLVVLSGGVPSGTLLRTIRDSLHRRAFEVAVFGLAAGGYFLLRGHALSAGDSGVSGVVTIVSGSDSTIFDTARVLLKVYGFYVKKLFVPWPLNFTIVHVADYYVLLGVLALLVLGFTMRHNRFVGSCLFFSSCMIAPALLVPLGRFAWTPVAERYLYMASPTFAIALAFIGAGFIVRHAHMRSLSIAAAVLIVGLFVSVHGRNMIWQSNLSLYEDSVKKSPDFVPARNELALALQEAGHVEQAQQIILSNSLPNDNKFSVITNLGKATVLINTGKYREAKKLLSTTPYASSSPLHTRYVEEIIRANENLIADKHTSLAEKKSLNDEIITLLLGLQKATADPFYYYRIGQRYLRAHKDADAQQYFRLAYVNAPANAHYRSAAKQLSEKLKP